MRPSEDYCHRYAAPTIALVGRSELNRAAF